MKRIGGKGQRDPPHLVGNRGALGPLALHEFQSRGGGEEEVAHLDDRAAIAGRRPHRRCDTALDRDLRAIARFHGRTDGEPGDRTDRRQCFAAKAERADVENVIAELAGAVARDGERQFVGGHAASIVDHPQQRQSAAGRRDLDARRAGVDGILDQFLDHGGRPLHDFAGGDSVDDRFWKLADGH